MRPARARAARWSVALLGLVAAGTPAPAAAQAARDSAARARAAAARDVAPSPGVRAAADSTTRAAERAAREWLWLLDEQRYDRAWTLVAPAMRSLVGYAQWTASLERLRAVLPRPLRRELQRAERSVPLFGGSSFILSFAVGGGGLREIVVLVRSAAGWQVGGYGILPY